MCAFSPVCVCPSGGVPPYCGVQKSCFEDQGKQEPAQRDTGNMAQSLVLSYRRIEDSYAGSQQGEHPHCVIRGTYKGLLLDMG